MQSENGGVVGVLEAVESAFAMLEADSTDLTKTVAEFDAAVAMGTKLRAPLACSKLLRAQLVLLMRAELLLHWLAMRPAERVQRSPTVQFVTGGTRPSN